MFKQSLNNYIELHDKKMFYSHFIKNISAQTGIVSGDDPVKKC